MVAGGASKVVVSEPSESHRARAKAVWAKPVEPDAVSEEMADIVFECVGRVETMKAALNAARPGGTVMWVGVAPPEAEVNVKPYDRFRKELTIRGSYTNPYVMERALALLASGRIDWREIVTHRFPLGEFREAWEAHRTGAGLKMSVYPENNRP